MLVHETRESAGAMAMVIRCLTCRRIEFAKVIHRDVYRPETERMPVEQVRTEAWCAGHERTVTA
jgi:hypothetical protein